MGVCGLCFCPRNPPSNHFLCEHVTRQNTFVLQGALLSDPPQNSRLGSALAQIPDLNGDGSSELVVGAPLEDEHQGAVYVFYGRDRTVGRRHKQVRDTDAAR